MNRLKRFLQTALTYFIGNILSKLITFVLIPIYTNKLTPSEYGNYDLVITIITLFVSVAFFQIWDGMFRFSFECKEDNEKYDVVCDTLYFYLIGIFLYLVAFYFAFCILKFDYYIFALIFGLIYGLQYVYSFIARVFLRNKLFVFSGTANTLVTALCNIVFIIYLDYGVVSLYLSQICGCIIQILIIEMSIKIRKRFFKHRPNIKALRKMLKFSIPLCIATISYWLLNGFTKLVINQCLGAYENGIYAIASSLANIVVITVNVFQFAWNETAYMMANDTNRKILYKKSIELLFVTVVYGCAILCIGVKLLFPFMIGSEYSRASEIIPILMIGVSSNAIAGFLGTIFMTERKTSYILISTVCVAFVNISLSKISAVIVGIQGIVFILSFSFILLMAIRLFFLKQNFNISINISCYFTSIVVIISLLMYKYVTSIIPLVVYIFILIFMYLMISQKLMGINFFGKVRKEKV